MVTVSAESDWVIVNLGVIILSLLAVWTKYRGVACGLSFHLPVSTTKATTPNLFLTVLNLVSASTSHLSLDDETTTDRDRVLLFLMLDAKKRVSQGQIASLGAKI